MKKIEFILAIQYFLFLCCFFDRVGSLIYNKPYKC